MPKVSKRKVNKEAEYINNFWRAVAVLSKKEDARDFLKALLTPSEMLMLAKRLEIAKQLLDEAHYQDIVREVKVANATIANIQRSMEGSGHDGYLRPLQRIGKFRKKPSRSKSKLSK